MNPRKLTSVQSTFNSMIFKNAHRTYEQGSPELVWKLQYVGGRGGGNTQLLVQTS
jgi:hypothetical protein